MFTAIRKAVASRENTRMMRGISVTTCGRLMWAKSTASMSCKRRRLCDCEKSAAHPRLCAMLFGL